MKKLLLLFVVLAAAAAPLTAANPDKTEMTRRSPKHITGIRAGMNAAWISATEDGVTVASDIRIAYHLGISDQLRLTRKLPDFRLEYGLYLSARGGTFRAHDNLSEDISLHPLYLQVPVLVNYHIHLGHSFTLEPFAGVYYALGIGGKIKGDYHEPGTCLIYGFDDPCFGASSDIHRSDFGIRFGLGATWKKLHLNIGYEPGLINLRKESARDIKLINNCVTISLGYNF